jgi:hypothetical protein
MMESATAVAARGSKLQHAALQHAAATGRARCTPRSIWQGNECFVGLVDAGGNAGFNDILKRSRPPDGPVAGASHRLLVHTVPVDKVDISRAIDADHHIDARRGQMGLRKL